MLYKFKNGKVLTHNLEYSVSYHCNLRCAGCSHLSPFSQKKFPSLESFCDDIRKLSEGLHASEMRLLGGEPLLNPEISTYIKEAKESGIANAVSITTNGLLLHKMDDDFWENEMWVVLPYILATNRKKSQSRFSGSVPPKVTQGWN